MANFFIEVHLSTAKLTLYLASNCFWISSTVSAYSLRQMLLSVQAEGTTNLLRNGWYDHRSSRFVFAFHGIWADTHPKMRQQFQVSLWSSAVWKSIAASSERIFCQFSFNRQDVNVKYEFPLRTYNCKSSTSLPLQYGHSWVINHRTRQFGYFRLG